MSASARLGRATADHRVSIQYFVERVESLDDVGWEAPWGEGTWTTREVTEHLVLYYEAAIRALRGEGELRPRVGPGTARVLRWFLLPHILFHRTLPIRARAPREIRPTGSTLSRLQMLRALTEAAARFEEQVARAEREGAGPLNHPYFGPISPLRFLRFSAIHVDHHRRQLEAIGPSSD